MNDQIKLALSGKTLPELILFLTEVNKELNQRESGKNQTTALPSPDIKL